MEKKILDFLAGDQCEWEVFQEQGAIVSPEIQSVLGDVDNLIRHLDSVLERVELRGRKSELDEG